MHVCFLCHEYPPARHGGIGSFTQTLARCLVQKGHAVTVAGLYPQPEPSAESDQGVQVIRLNQGRIPGLRILANRQRLMAQLKALHGRHPIDVIEGAERSFYLVDADLPIPKIIRMHGGYTYLRTAMNLPLSQRIRRQEVLSFRHATHVCAVSRYVAETTRALLELGDIPIPVILNPVDLQLFQPLPDVEEQEGLIVYVGSIMELKGIRYLLRAMPGIVAGCPSARLVAYGNDTLHPTTGRSFTETLKADIPAGIQDRIEFAGPVKRQELPALMARAQVCIYPSLIEALPIAWIEGLAMGKAIVASGRGPGPEVVEDGVSGLLCDPLQPESITRQVLALLRQPALRQCLGQAARRRAETLFSLDELVRRNIAYYESCRSSACN